MPQVPRGTPSWRAARPPERPRGRSPRVRSRSPAAPPSRGRREQRERGERWTRAGREAAIANRGAAWIPYRARAPGGCLPGERGSAGGARPAAPVMLVSRAEVARRRTEAQGPRAVLLSREAAVIQEQERIVRFGRPLPRGDASRSADSSSSRLFSDSSSRSSRNPPREMEARRRGGRIGRVGPQ